MRKVLLSVSSLYMAVVGLALTFFPIAFGRGAVPVDAGPELVAFLRVLGGPCLGIATLDWLSRHTERPAVDAIMFANIAGFAAVTANDAWGVASGASRDIAGLFLVVHLLFTCAFVAVAWIGFTKSAG